jgi:energy-coupling factor transporter ATP-binding protein EcfA2
VEVSAQREAPSATGASEGFPDSLQERIYQWSTGLPPWQSDLLRRLTYGPLTNEEELEVIRALLETKDAPAPQPLERSDLPVDEADTGPVELCEIQNVENVNLLAERQRLRFMPGLNVIFGATGAGKSGYGRLLRHLCQSGDGTEVLPNAFDASSGEKAQVAGVQIALGEETRDVVIDLADVPAHVLSAVAVFDASRASLCVSGPNIVGHVPPPLLVMRRLVEAQEALKARIKERVAVLQSELSATDVDPENPAGRRLATTITAETDPGEIERLGNLTEDELAEKGRLDAALAMSGQDQSRQLQAAARARARAAEKVVEQLERASAQLSDERLQAIADLRLRFDEATAAERALADDAFAGQSFAGTGQKLWREMWEAARRFAEAGNRPFPAEESQADCPLCQQCLDVEANERMFKFEEFLQSDLREKIASLANDLSRTMDEIRDATVSEALVDASLSGAPDEVIDSARDALEGLDARAQTARRRAKGSPDEQDSYWELPSLEPIRAYVVEQAGMAKAQAGAGDEAAQRKMTERRKELREREQVAAAVPKLLDRISGLVKIARYKKASAQLSMAKINTQLRKLQADVVTVRLRRAILEELKAFDLLAAEIDMAGKAKGGRTAIEFSLRGPERKDLEHILSEGEQRALALAFFLAESSVNGGRSAIVLDDPAALLDLERREHVAERLAEEAQRRQVIVMTHDLAFVQMLNKAAVAFDQEIFNQVLRRENGRAGVLQIGNSANSHASAAIQ